MFAETYKPYLSKEDAEKALDEAYDCQVDYIDRPDLGEPGPRGVPLTRARQTALAIFNKLSARAGLDVREIINYDTEVLAEIVDEATDIIDTAFDVTAGPVTWGVARELNALHALGRDWEVSYTAKDKEFQVSAYRADNGMDYVKSDSLFDAIHAVRQQNKPE